MNGKKLLIGLSYIDRKYIEESEQDMPVRNAITTTINQNKSQIDHSVQPVDGSVAGKYCFED